MECGLAARIPRSMNCPLILIDGFDNNCAICQLPACRNSYQNRGNSSVFSRSNLNRSKVALFQLARSHIPRSLSSLSFHGSAVGRTLPRLRLIFFRFLSSHGSAMGCPLYSRPMALPWDALSRGSASSSFSRGSASLSANPCSNDLPAIPLNQPKYLRRHLLVVFTSRYVIQRFSESADQLESN